MNFPQLLPQLVQLSIDAGKCILEVYNDPNLNDQVDYKADNSPLTLADKAAHICIEAGLEKLNLDLPLLSEEGKHAPYAERKNWKKFWLIDPLDGTKEFVKRNGEFTVNIALVEAGRSVLGVVHVPVSGLTYFAAKGFGAFRQEAGGEPKPIRSAQFGLKDEGLRIVASRSHTSENVQKYISQFAAPEVVSMGSSLKFMLVAEAKADIYPRLAPTMEWDTAAAQIIVEEAGGTVMQHKTGEPVIYNKENLLNPWFVAQGKHILNEELRVKN